MVFKGSTEGMKIEKAEKPVADFHDKKDHVIYIRNLKQTLNHWIGIGKMHRVIKFNQEAWLKAYFDLNPKLGKNTKANFEKDFKLMSNGNKLSYNDLIIY